MEEWYNNATPEDKHRISKLQIPESLIEALQPGQKRELRCKVAEHQYLTMIGMTQLRGTLPMMPKDPARVEGNAGSAWYGALRARKVSPNVNEKNLREQVHYRPKKRTTRVVKADQQCKGTTAPLRQVYNKVKVYAVGDGRRRNKKKETTVAGHTAVPHNADHRSRQSARTDMSNTTAAVVHTVWTRKPHANRRI